MHMVETGCPMCQMTFTDICSNPSPELYLLGKSTMKKGHVYRCLLGQSPRLHRISEFANSPFWCMWFAIPGMVLSWPFVITGRVKNESPDKHVPTKNGTGSHSASQRQLSCCEQVCLWWALQGHNFLVLCFMVMVWWFPMAPIQC